MLQTVDYERRFGGVSRLYGTDGAHAIANTHFIVVGVGGVGSWAVESLVRTGAERITLIDLDNVAESNVNRQIQALGDTFGKAKVHVLSERATLINPRLKITAIEEFVDEENVTELIPSGAVGLDCIDQVRAKAALISHCKKIGNFIITSGAAGGRTDPSCIKSGDLARLKGDPLLSNVRYRLRKAFGFPKAGTKNQPLPFKITAVYSDEPVRRPLGQSCNSVQTSGLACSGYGSGVVVTASMGMRIASIAINHVVPSHY